MKAEVVTPKIARRVTPETFRVAEAVRDELLMIFNDARGIVDRINVLVAICDVERLPWQAAGLMQTAGGLTLAASAAHEQYYGIVRNAEKNSCASPESAGAGRQPAPAAPEVAA